MTSEQRAASSERVGARRPHAARRPLIGAALLLALALWVWFGPVPPIDQAAFTSATIVDRHGIVLYEPLSPRGTRGEWLSDPPANVINATIAAEDRRFFHHIGIDPIAVARAALHDVKHLRIVEGGSTITQQVAKMLLGHRNKLYEAIIALRLERKYSKREILALYLNLAPYGDQTVGIARASRRWFGCPPENLTVAQAAFLAALPQRPAASRALVRQRIVLRRMRDLGMIDAQKFADARAERLKLDRAQQPLLAAHFVERVRERYPNARRIETSLDANLQREVQGIIAAARPTLLRHGAHSAAVAVLDNRTGEWLAWEGSGDYFGDTFGGAIDGVVTPRQPGSALKPFTYAVAFERGFTPATVLPDIASSFPTAEEGVVYTPRNYDGRYRGPLRVRLALAGSENVPAVATLAKIGPPALLRFLRQNGFKTFNRTADYYGLGLTLGDAEVTLEQLVTAYATFARAGEPVTPSMLKGAARGTRHTALSPRTAFWITNILSDSAARAWAFGEGGSLDFPFPVAVKTGTSQAYRDNWCVGYTRDVTVGVWVGNFDRNELHNSSGVTGAGPIFHSVMLAAMKGRVAGDIVDVPPGIERVPICALSGLRPSTSCPQVEMEWLPTDAPVTFCSWHHEGRIDWPPEYRDWAGVKPESLRATATRRASLRVTNPVQGATYLIDPTLRTPFQALHLRAAADAPVHWTVDGQGVREEWPLTPGKHTIIATDDAGHRDTVTITVK